MHPNLHTEGKRKADDEVKDGVYSITINASEPESVQTEEAASNVNWYEVIKIVLLAVLVVNMLWKPRKEHTKC